MTDPRDARIAELERELAEAKTKLESEQIGDDPKSFPFPREGIICFHCGVRFRTWGSARDHFGGTPLDRAACEIKAGEELGLVMALRRAQSDASAYASQCGFAKEKLEKAESSLTAAQARIAELEGALTVFSLMQIVEKGFGAWAAKPHNYKWARKLDGTPIQNDLIVNIAEVISTALAPAEEAK